MYMTLFTYILLALIVLLTIWVTRLELRIARLLAGKNAKTLEDTIVRLRDELTRLFEYKRSNDERLDKFDTRIKRSVQWIETVRFNPFKDQGSNQSWSSVFVNEHGDGIALTGIWGRDKSSVYAKPIKNRVSEYELSNEEKELLGRVSQ
ncbi:MAG TPA: DUF4446 family protein [Candidatus Paceibacterota bacterium]